MLDLVIVGMIKQLVDTDELDDFLEYARKRAKEDGFEEELKEALDDGFLKASIEFAKMTPPIFEEEEKEEVDGTVAKIIDKLSDVICKCTGCDVTVNSDFEATVELEECNFRIQAMNNALNCYGYIAKDWIITTDGSNVLLCFDLEEL